MVGILDRGIPTLYFQVTGFLQKKCVGIHLVYYPYHSWLRTFLSYHPYLVLQFFSCFFILVYVIVTTALQVTSGNRLQVDIKLQAKAMAKQIYICGMHQCNSRSPFRLSARLSAAQCARTWHDCTCMCGMHRTEHAHAVTKWC